MVPLSFLYQNKIIPGIFRKMWFEFCPIKLGYTSLVAPKRWGANHPPPSDKLPTLAHGAPNFPSDHQKLPKHREDVDRWTTKRHWAGVPHKPKPCQSHHLSQTPSNFHMFGGVSISNAGDIYMFCSNMSMSQIVPHCWPPEKKWSESMRISRFFYFCNSSAKLVGKLSAFDPTTTILYLGPILAHRKRYIDTYIHIYVYSFCLVKCWTCNWVGWKPRNLHRCLDHWRAKTQDVPKLGGQIPSRSQKMFFFVYWRQDMSLNDTCWPSHLYLSARLE